MQTTTRRPDHFMILDNGDLCDMRKDGSPVLRKRYRYHHREIDTVADLKATLRAGPLAWPGLYPLYFVMADGSVMSFDGVRENLREVSETIERQLGKASNNERNNERHTASLDSLSGKL